MNKMFGQIYENIFAECNRLSQLEIDIYNITGLTLEQIKESFLAGYTLNPPDNANIDFRTIMKKLYQ